MNPLKVCTCRVAFAAMLGLLSVGEAKDAAAFQLFSSGDSGDCCQVARQCDCQQRDCAGPVWKDNLLTRSAHALVGHLHALLPSRNACDEVSCDDACDSMMLEELIEMREAAEAAAVSPSPSSSKSSAKSGTAVAVLGSDEVNDALQDSGTWPVTVVPIRAVGRASNAKLIVPHQLGPNENALEGLSRDGLQISSPGITNPAPTGGSKSTIIPAPIRHDNL